MADEITNRLGGCTSPYLLQHASNPVSWQPWDEEAIELAKKLDRPLLVSIGYAACHWCHVMEHESFNDEPTAKQMNESLVCIKVDREESPDVDALYMAACQIYSGGGGWPLNVFVDPDTLKPFFAGTYFPPVQRYNKPSWGQLIESVVQAWQEQREQIINSSELITEQIQKSSIGKGSSQAVESLIKGSILAGLSHSKRVYDPVNGGIGGAPKFPHPMEMEGLLRAGERDIVSHSLDVMATRGLFDHLAGGWHRYCVDAEWAVPHFEKMLYDNALLARAYLHGWQVLGHDHWRQVASETIEYVLRDLHHPDGGFLSAEEADSEGVEGKFYVWSEAEVREVCGVDADAAVSWYGISENGNFEGANILHRPVRGDLSRPDEVERARQALFARRQARVRPGLDDKVLTEWNGLMLATLAEAALAVGREDWLEAATANADFLCRTLRRPDGRWLRSWQADAGAHTLGYAADHAAMVDGLTRLGEASGEARWTELAVSTADVLLDRFLDRENGGFHGTGDDAEALVRRPKDLLDNAQPSANSLAAVALLRLGALVGDTRYVEVAVGVLHLLGDSVTGHPTAFGHLLGAVDLHHTGITEVVVTGDRPDLVAAVAGTWRPNTVLAWGEPFGGPLWEGRDGDRAWVCREFACRAPVDSTDDLRAELA